MTPEEIRRLLAGYATGTLSESERAELFQAAMKDQALFDALADEEGLRELLADPEMRGELLSALEEPAQTLFDTPADVSGMRGTLQSARDEQGRRSAPNWRRWYAFMGATATLGLVAAFFLTRPTPGPKLEQMAQLSRMEVGPPEAVQMREELAKENKVQREEARRTPATRPAAQPPAQPAASPPEPAQTSAPVVVTRQTADALAEATPGRVTLALRSAASSYRVEQRDAAGTWKTVEELRADVETRIVIRFPATGLVTATAGGREIARVDVETSDPVSLAVPSAAGPLTVTVNQASSRLILHIPLRFLKP
ncbi:MAG: hypothetical protein JNN08_04605 [Bryobacterales bacterium]|nr:hypothetical protein [Bryobacterales bacterium]